MESSDSKLELKGLPYCSDSSGDDCELQQTFQVHISVNRMMSLEVEVEVEVMVKIVMIASCQRQSKRWPICNLWKIPPILEGVTISGHIFCFGEMRTMAHLHGAAHAF
jgi:hypothetical protein